MTILYQTVILVVLFLLKEPLLRLIKHDVKKSPKSVASFFSKIKRWDHSCRLAQYGLVFISGYLQSAALYITDHAGLIILGKARQLDIVSNIMSSNRKIIRALRLTGVFGDINGWYQLGKLQLQKPSFRLLVLIQILMGFLSDFFNLLYYFTDHYSLCFLFGIFTNQALQVQADYWGNVFWIISNVFLAVKDILTIYRLRFEKGKSQKIEIKFAFFDFIRNIIDTIIAFCYFDENIVSKRDVGLMGVASSVIMLADFWK